jgi:hypothetical protein
MLPIQFPELLQLDDGQVFPGLKITAAGHGKAFNDFLSGEIKFFILFHHPPSLFHANLASLYFSGQRISAYNFNNHSNISSSSAFPLAINSIAKSKPYL